MRQDWFNNQDIVGLSSQINFEKIHVMKHSPEFRSKREEERAAAKKTVGYKLWSVLFTLMYPFIAVFTFVFSCIVMFFSGISRVLAYVLGKSHAEH